MREQHAAAEHEKERTKLKAMIEDRQAERREHRWGQVLFASLGMTALICGSIGGVGYAAIITACGAAGLAGAAVFRHRRVLFPKRRDTGSGS